MKSTSNKAYLFILTLFVTGNPIGLPASHRTETGIIKWSPSYKLDFADFQGDYTKEAVAAQNVYMHTIARSYIGIRYDLKTVGRELKINGYAIFDKKKSWTKTASSRVLKHEQGHFDITEIYALQLEKTMNQGTYKDVDAFLDSLKSVSERITTELNKKNSEYDELSRSEILEPGLYQWIDEQLKLYKASQ